MSVQTLRGARHHLCLDFTDDGRVDFFPTTDDPADLARRLAFVVRMLLEHPSAIGCAAGYHPDGACVHDAEREP